MANYNNYYPYNPYNTYGVQPYQSAVQQQQQAQPQIHNGGYVSVRSEDEALMYPVAPGNSVTFINEIAPYQYKKTMGFSQFDKPIFEKFRIVREEAENAPKTGESNQDGNCIDFAKKREIEALKHEIEALQEQIETIKDDIQKLFGKTEQPETKKNTYKKKEADE